MIERLRQVTQQKLTFLNPNVPIYGVLLLLSRIMATDNLVMCNTYRYIGDTLVVL